MPRDSRGDEGQREAVENGGNDQIEGFYWFK